MSIEVRDIEKPFKEMLDALDPDEQRKAMRSAMRKSGNKLRKQAQAELAGSKLNHASQMKKDIRVRVYPARYGAGFMLTVKPHGKQGYHKNRQGKEKPILMWAEEGTKYRKTKGKMKLFSRSKKGHWTGEMPAYGFLEKTEQKHSAEVEQNLFTDFEKQLEKRLKKKGLL